MTGGRVFTIDPGTPFLPELASALGEGRLVPGFGTSGDPMEMASATIYLPTRRAVRTLRAILSARSTSGSVILPSIRALGEFDEDAPFFEDLAPAADLAPPIDPVERVLTLAPLVRAWKERLPRAVTDLFGDEDIVVPASFTDAIWLARDLAALMDEVETEGADWTILSGLAPDALAEWWQVTLEFLAIVTKHWPDHLEAIGRSNPAAHRNALIEAEAERLRRNPPQGPVIAAGSTGSIPATAQLLATIAGLDKGALVLPGLDLDLDEAAWSLIGTGDAAPSVFGHPQYGLKKLLDRLRLQRNDVVRLGAPSPDLAARRYLVSQALRPAESTDHWASQAEAVSAALGAGALDGVSLAEAANETEEALAIAIALRSAITSDNARAALVTGDRVLARRVAADLLRFGVVADDSAGRPLTGTPPAELLLMLAECAARPGDPVRLLSVLKHPLLHLGFERAWLRETAEYFELSVLRGGTGRPDIANLPALTEERLAASAASPWPPFWRDRLGANEADGVRRLAQVLSDAVTPLASLRGREDVTIREAVIASVQALEACGRESDGGLRTLYAGENGEQLASALRGLLVAEGGAPFAASEWPDVLAALLAPHAVKPRPGAEQRIQILGQLEARLHDFDLVVLGGLNEGSWPRRADADRFMSRVMKSAMALEPPERRIGQSAHDFEMAMGGGSVLLTRAVRAENAPSTASRWLQRLTTFAGRQATADMKARGAGWLTLAQAMDDAPKVPFAPRPAPKPPLDRRPKRLSVTEVETLRRDPYAIHARKVLRLQPLDDLLRDPGAAERGNLFHEILHRFTTQVIDANAQEAEAVLLRIGRQCFDELTLPADVDAVWWPRFEKMAPNIIAFERERQRPGLKRLPEISAEPQPVGGTGVVLSGRADRIDLSPEGMVDILDYKTGPNPSLRQARTFISPQLALEAALLARGAFPGIRAGTPVSQLHYVRLRANGAVDGEAVCAGKVDGETVPPAPELAEQAWARLEEMLAYYNVPENGYMSRLLPFLEGDVSGPYDHLARVLEWSAAGESDEGGGEA